MIPSKGTYDFIIVGQGIAGSSIAFQLLKRKKTVLVIDPGGNNATKVAAGNINPLTGRAFTKSWMIDELLEEALPFYKALGELIGSEVLRSTEIYRTIRSIKEENKWMGRLQQEGYERYINDIQDTIAEAEIYNEHPLGFGKVNNALQVDTQWVIEGYRAFLASKGLLLEEAFIYESMRLESNAIRYNDYTASAIIFAEGRGVVNNPYFNYLPIEPTKGEALIVELSASFHKNIKDNVFISPVSEGYWVGSGYEWEFDSDGPSQKGKAKLEASLQKSIGQKYHVIDHKAGVRPCVKDRRPLLGRHHIHNNVICFNGMGTKGTSLAPYFSKHLTQHLLDDSPLLPAVDITRYQSLYPM